MSSAPPDPPDPSEHEAPSDLASRLSQMGLAAYTLLLLTIAGVGLICAVFSLQGAISLAVAPHAVASGFTVDTWRLTELRREGILGEAEVPDLYHDHTRMGDGSAGCMVVEGQVVRWDVWLETGRVPVAGATVDSTGEPSSPTVRIRSGSLSVECPFEEDEGGERFETMLQFEAATPAEEG
jgi:hypothetical protein